MKIVPGKIILVDDKRYERPLLIAALTEKNWKIDVDYFQDAQTALEYLKRTEDQIFIIISEVRMRGMSGLQFKKAIDENEYLRRKAIPFVFVSSTASLAEVSEAYDYRVQGFFKKPIHIVDQADMLDKMIKYWILCRHPVSSPEVWPFEIRVKTLILNNHKHEKNTIHRVTDCDDSQTAGRRHIS